ncbi:MAG: hypothetical protein RMI93_04785 [Caldimicrobium sp.]|nr:hypothetical protein [Caldimicrobium sp.]MDW8182903.1 hypothetical protein [Caldimicrobium sp.]
MWQVDLPMKSSHLSSRSGRDFWSKFWSWEGIAFGVDLLQI